METGKVTRIIRERGFFFIKPDDGGDDVFAHISDVQREPGFSFDSLTEGMEVEFELTSTTKGPRAANVTRA